MCGVGFRGKAFIKMLLSKLNEQPTYQVKNGQQTEWISLDEVMKRNREKHLYQNLLGENKNESIERNFRHTNGKNEANQILSVSTFCRRK